MKKAALFYLFILSFTASAQNITFSELISFVNKSKWEDIDLSLMKKGWAYFSSEEESEDSYGKIIWSYKISFDDKAQGWIHLYTNENSPVKISFQFHTKPIYNSMLSSLSSGEYKKTNSKITDDGLITEYNSKGYEIILMTTSNESDYITKTAYTIQVRKKSSYEISLSTPKNGMHKEYDENNTLLGDFTYKNNILNGPYRLYEDNNIVETGTYINGTKNGVFKTFSSEGLIQIEGLYLNDEQKGLHTYFFYDEEGKLEYKSRGVIINNMKEGLWKDFVLVKGKETVTQYYTYNEDVLNGVFKIIEEENIIIGNYSNGVLDGTYKVYIDYLTAPGELLYGETSKAYLSEEGFYKNGMKNGKWLYYDKSKKVVKEVVYVDDVEQ